jgi:diguanylate cyclase (GGDEF)-like protein
MTGRVLQYRCVLLALFALGVGLHPICAAPYEPWQDRADVVFRPIPQSASQTAMVLPTVIAEDAQGFLWAAGQTGLLRWDGYRFHVYTTDSAMPDGLPDHGIAALHLDMRGTLWVGTLSGYLARYDVTANRFTLVALPADPKVVQCVWAIDDDGEGGLFIATHSGLFHLDASGHIDQQMRHDPGQPDSLPDTEIQALVRGRDGTLWVGGAHGLARGVRGMDGRMAFEAVPLPTGGPDAGEVSRLLEDGWGRLWIGTRQQGAFVLLPGAAKAMQIRATARTAAGDAPTEIMSITEVAPGRIWLGTFGRGIVEVTGAAVAERRIHHDPLVPASLASDSIFSLYTDRSGLTWVGTTVGLGLYNPAPGILTLFGREVREAGRSIIPTEGIAGFDSSAILARPDGGLWVGSEAGGVDILDASGRDVANLPLQRVFALAAADGALLAGTRDGLYRANTANWHFTRLTLPGRRNTDGVFCLHVRGASIWLGGADDGIWVFHFGPDGQPVVERHIDAPALTSPVVHVIVDAPDGKVAAGTTHGFDLIDPVSWRVEQVVHDAAEPESLGAGGIEAFAVGALGRLWVGTDTSGINVLTGRDARGRPRFHHIGVADGLPNADINVLLPDAQGRVWASTDNGLAAVNTTDFSVRAVTQADGLAITAYWNNAGARLAGGTLVFGGTGGLTFVHPEEVRPWTYQPPVQITGLRLGGKPAHVMPPEAADNGTPWLIVPPDINAMSAEFAALDFSSPERNRYRYRLVGFDFDWISTDAAHRVAAYTNLPPGEYVLQVEGSNHDGIWARAPASLHIRVLPAWYQTYWFRVLELLAGLACIFGIVQLRTLMLRKRQGELERMVHERTNALQASERRLQEFAYVDALTGLPNRHAFNEYFQKLLGVSVQQQTSFALILIDLDGFKQVNDTLGHDAGDMVLSVAAGRFVQAVRQGDFVARLGGDEFAILLPGLPDKTAVAPICERAVSGMAKPVRIKRSHAIVGASLGAALFPDHGTTQDALYKQADLALYEAKRAGKGGWRWYQVGADLTDMAAAPQEQPLFSPSGPEASPQPFTQTAAGTIV